MASLFVAARFYSFERSTDDSSYVMAGALELCPSLAGPLEPNPTREAALFMPSSVCRAT